MKSEANNTPCTYNQKCSLGFYGIGKDETQGNEWIGIGARNVSWVGDSTVLSSYHTKYRVICCDAYGRGWNGGLVSMDEEVLQRRKRNGTE